MEPMEHDTIVLKKILNSELFLSKFPIINRVEVDMYGIDGIDIVLIPNDTKQYWLDKNEMYNFIWNIAKMSSVTSRFRVYP